VSERIRKGGDGFEGGGASAIRGFYGHTRLAAGFRLPPCLRSGAAAADDRHIDLASVRSSQGDLIARIHPWFDVTAWVLVAVGVLATAILVAWTQPPLWWLLETMSILALAGTVVGAEGALRRRASLARAREGIEHMERHAPGVLFTATPEGVIRRASDAAGRILGRSTISLRGMLLATLTTDPMPPLWAAGPAEVRWDTRWRMPDGSTRPLTTLLYPAWGPDGRLTGIRGVIHDYSEQEAVEHALRESESRFRRVVDAAQNGIVVTDHEGRILLTNNSLHHLLGYSADELAELTLADIVHPSFIDQLVALMASRAWSDAAPSSYEVQFLHHEGRPIDVEVSLAAIREQGRSTDVLIEVRDLTEARQAVEAIRRMSDYDRLTGLPNRELFDRHLQRAITDAEAQQRSVGVVLLDLDRFKLINDTLGHASGDRLLQSVAQRLQESLPPRHLLARFSGDEYLVLCPDLSGVGAVEATARRVLASFAEPFPLDGHSIQITATAGVAVFPAHASDSETLIRLADAALHEAKASGGNTYRTGSNDAEDPARRRFQLESDLRLAVERGELALHYQPQVDITSGAITSFEALLRWHHPERGTVRPDEFIPLLEETGLIVEVGERVLRTAVEQTRAWRDRGFHDVRVAVNLSPRQFLVSDLDQRIKAILDEAGLPAGALEVELTESSGLLDLESVSGILDGLHAIGITTAIDDFGIGQSWLGRLQQFRIGTLKVDRSFIARIDASGNDFAIVEAIVALGHALGMTIVAEGVETREQLDIVRGIGCDLVQGFLFAPAMAPEDAERLLREGWDSIAA
jgi:diguanylate cyclase (GGDEF)-like protein/PAS domain S-box-containing protein